MWNMPYKITGDRQNQMVVWELALLEIFLFSDFPKVNELNVKYAI